MAIGKAAFTSGWWSLQISFEPAGFRADQSSAAARPLRPRGVRHSYIRVRSNEIDRILRQAGLLAFRRPRKHVERQVAFLAPRPQLRTRSAVNVDPARQWLSASRNYHHRQK